MNEDNEEEEEEEVILEADYCSCNLKDFPDSLWQYSKTLTKLVLESNSIEFLPDVSLTSCRVSARARARACAGSFLQWYLCSYNDKYKAMDVVLGDLVALKSLQWNHHW